MLFVPDTPDLRNWRAFAGETRMMPVPVFQFVVEFQTGTNSRVIPGEEFDVLGVFAIGSCIGTPPRFP